MPKSRVWVLFDGKYENERKKKKSKGRERIEKK